MSATTPHTEPNTDLDEETERANGLTDEQVKGLLGGAPQARPRVR